MNARVVLLLLLAILLPAVAEAQCSPPYLVEQKFPVAGAEISRWRVCWQVIDGPGLVITGAWFRPTPASAWIQVLYDGRMSQLFVPYHAGSPRYYDVSYGFGSVSLDDTVDCPPPRQRLGTANEVCKEVRDRGLMWKYKTTARRGDELVLWSDLSAGNYDYIIEWTFRDDGVIQTRIGATGKIANNDTHMHGPIWRLDIDLNGACCDTASLMSHKEMAATGIDTMTDVNKATGEKWVPEEYTMLHVRDANLKNANGKSSMWNLMPFRTGTPFHDEPFTWFAIWVTPYVWSQTWGDQLPSYVAGAPATNNRDIVVWYYAGAHHVVRDEDRKGNVAGMTLLMYDGFQLMPFNVWPESPFYP